MSNWTGFLTLTKRECHRFLRLYSQTILPPMVTAVLFILIFGYSLGSRISQIAGVSYIEYILPGLVMMGVITSAYANSSSSLFIMKFQGNIEEVLISPLSYLEIVIALMVGGVARGILVGIGILLVALFFAKVIIVNVLAVLFFITLVSVIFSCAGIVTALWAQNFDQLNIFSTFLITPLVYLGGVFYSISMLPEFWAHLSKVNPILYMVNGFRFGFIGQADVPLGACIAVVLMLAVFFFVLCVHLFRKGYNLRV